jgi:hypothetical protein
MRLKNAALFAVGFLSVSSWLYGSARCETSLAPPLSLAPPASVTAKGSPPPAATNVWPPMATDDVPPPRSTAKRSAPPVTAEDTLPTATAKDAPPTATAKRSAPAATAKLSPSPKPAADYDGFTVGIVDEDTSGQTTLPVRPRPAKQPKLRQKLDSIEEPWARQQSVDQAEDDKLKRKLTICRGCKG